MRSVKDTNPASLLFSVDEDDTLDDEGGEYGRILESTSSSSFPLNSNDAILRKSSMGNDAMVVASSAKINRVAMSSDEVTMLSARSTGENVDEEDDEDEEEQANDKDADGDSTKDKRRDRGGRNRGGRKIFEPKVVNSRAAMLDAAAAPKKEVRDKLENEFA